MALDHGLKYFKFFKPKVILVQARDPFIWSSRDRPCRWCQFTFLIVLGKSTLPAPLAPITP